MKKKLLVVQKVSVFALSFLLLSSPLSQSVFAQSAPDTAAIFTDVTASNPHYGAIKNLKDGLFIKGYPDGSFKPDAAISRAEATAILAKIGGITAEKSTAKPAFTDIAPDNWFFNILQRAAQLKKIKGFEDGSYKPLNPVNLPEAVALSFSLLNVDTRGTAVEGTIYAGLDSKAWYARIMQYAKNMFILTPTLARSTEIGRYDPTKAISRGEFAEIVYRTQQVKSTGHALDITTTWKTTVYKENYWQLKHPAEWSVFQGSLNSVLWNNKNYSAFFTRLWPRGVRLSISVVSNDSNLSTAAYFEMLKQGYNTEYGNGKSLFLSDLISGRTALKVVVPSNNVIDVHVELPNNKFLALYGEYGSAPLGEYLKKELELVIDSYTYVEAPPPEPKPVLSLDERLQKLREKVLVQSGWTEVKEYFTDKKLISTDGIGIGTGPVDYYFTQEGNMTIKLERNSGTVLNIKEGQTTAF